VETPRAQGRRAGRLPGADRNSDRQRVDLPNQMLIDGNWSAGSAGSFTDLDPVTEEVLFAASRIRHLDLITCTDDVRVLRLQVNEWPAQKGCELKRPEAELVGSTAKIGAEEATIDARHAARNGSGNIACESIHN
jgi:hypothetical protein